MRNPITIEMEWQLSKDSNDTLYAFDEFLQCLKWLDQHSIINWSINLSTTRCLVKSESWLSVLMLKYPKVSFKIVPVDGNPK